MAGKLAPSGSILDDGSPASSMLDADNDDVFDIDDDESTDKSGEEKSEVKDEKPEGKSEGKPEGKADESSSKSKYAGKTPEELIAILEENDKYKGKTGEEVGSLRKRVSDLEAQLTEKSKGEEPTFENRRSELRRQFEAGELSIDKYTDAVTDLATEEAAQKALTAVDARDAKLEAQRLQKKFLDDHPDFKEIAESGATQALIDANPILNHVSAYYAIKLRESAKTVEKLNQEIAGLKKQQDDSLEAQRNKNASKTLDAPGSGPKPAPTGRSKKGTVDVAKDLMGTLARIRSQS